MRLSHKRKIAHKKGTYQLRKLMPWALTAKREASDISMYLNSLSMRPGEKIVFFHLPKRIGKSSAFFNQLRTKNLVYAEPPEGVKPFSSLHSHQPEKEAGLMEKIGQTFKRCAESIIPSRLLTMFKQA